MTAPSKLRWIQAAVLVAIAFASVAPRFVLTKAGLPYNYHWDEPAVFNRAVRIVKTGDFNPRFFNYGSLLIYSSAAAVAATFLHSSSLPPEDPNAIQRLGQIETGGDGFRWYVSHPRLLRASRLVVAALGAATCLGVLLLGFGLGRPIAGALGAGVLALSRFHVESSAWVATDAPATAFAFAALALACYALNRGSPAKGLWILAAASCGFAAGFKYNAGVGLVVVLVALLASSLELRTKVLLVFLCPLATIGAFLVAVPYALLDLATFLQHAAYEIHHYAVRGHGEMSIEPGLAHLWRDVVLASGDFGLLALPFCLLGLYVLVARIRGGWVLPAGALLVLLLTARTKVEFHRNVLLVYPILALAFGLAVLWLWEELRERDRRLRMTLVGLVVVVFAVQAVRLTSRMSALLRPDPRSLVAAKVAGLRSEFERVEVARELRLHPFDRGSFAIPVEEGRLTELVCAPGDPETLRLLPRQVRRDPDHSPGGLDQLNRALARQEPTASFVLEGGALLLNRFTLWPGVMAVPASAIQPTAICESREPTPSEAEDANG